MNDRDPLYVLTEHDLNKIDGLVSMLNLAITEIINKRAVKDQYPDNEENPAQDDFNNECHDAIEPDPKKSSPE